MNHEKTGALIAKRRGELGLTQKALADQLNISDRAVSRWERGLGFPDISLIEPLADALGLTVLELLHGEEEPPTPEEERSARETLNTIRPEVHEKMKKKHRWIIVLTVVIVLLIAFFVMLAGAAREQVYINDATAAEATTMSPYTLITQNEFDLMKALYQDEEIVSKFTYSYRTARELDSLDIPEGMTFEEYVHEHTEEFFAQHVEYEMDEDFCGDYFRKFILPVRNLDYYRIKVSWQTVTVIYGTAQLYVEMQMYNDGRIQKTVTEYETPFWTEDGQPTGTDPDVLYCVSSTDNEKFYVSYYKTGLAALFG